MFIFFNDTATTEIYTLSLHDALPISSAHHPRKSSTVPGSPSTSIRTAPSGSLRTHPVRPRRRASRWAVARSEEHTSELQSRQYLVCRLLLAKKKQAVQRISRPASFVT